MHNNLLRLYIGANDRDAYRSVLPVQTGNGVVSANVPSEVGVMPLDKAELELLRIKMRLSLVEHLLLKTAIASYASMTGLSLEAARQATLDILESESTAGDAFFLSTYGVAQGALLADERREIVDSMKASIKKMVV